jgi:hypothetical protein
MRIRAAIVVTAVGAGLLALARITPVAGAIAVLCILVILCAMIGDTKAPSALSLECRGYLRTNRPRE